METVVMAVASTRLPKLGAVRQALESFSGALRSTLRSPDAQFAVVGVAVPSGVSHTPLGRGEIMAGARGRAEALMGLAREGQEKWRYFVGLEAGLDVIVEKGRRWVFLENWSFVSDGEGRESYGQSGGILLPEPLAQEVVDRGTELAVAMDRYAGASGIRDEQGAWGVLTNNLITRQESIRISVINAFAPIFNARLYSGDVQRG